VYSSRVMRGRLVSSSTHRSDITGVYGWMPPWDANLRRWQNATVLGGGDHELSPTSTLGFPVRARQSRFLPRKRQSPLVLACARDFLARGGGSDKFFSASRVVWCGVVLWRDVSWQRTRKYHNAILVASSVDYDFVCMIARGLLYTLAASWLVQ
jgi:hypothetical protein